MFVPEDATCRDTVNTTGESMSAVQARQEEARRKRRRKKRSGSSFMSSCFQGNVQWKEFRTCPTKVKKKLRIFITISVDRAITVTFRSMETSSNIA